NDKQDDRRAMELHALAEETVRRHLLRLPGVAEVSVRGGLRKRYEVALDRDKLVAFGLTPAAVGQALQGAAAPGQDLVRLLRGRAVDATKLETVVLATGPGGAAVRLRDVAAVRVGAVRPREEAAVQLRRGGRVEGGPAVVLVVRRRQDTEHDAWARS